MARRRRRLMALGDAEAGIPFSVHHEFTHTDSDGYESCLGPASGR